MKEKKKAEWFRMDRSAIIYIAQRSKRCSNIYRVSLTLDEPVAPETLAEALKRTVPRFPAIAARIRPGMFWYYLEPLKEAPELIEEGTHPLKYMTMKETADSALRVLYYEKRISVEIFHSITDGMGALTFLKTLCAEYLRIRYGADIPFTDGIEDPEAQWTAEETEDCYEKYAGGEGKPLGDSKVYRFRGTHEPDNYVNIITGTVESAELKKAASDMGVSITALLSAVMLKSLLTLQNQRSKRSRKPVSVLIPVDLRRMFSAGTLRNFILSITAAATPKDRDLSLKELAESVTRQMKEKITENEMRCKMKSIVSITGNPVIRGIPLFMKMIGLRRGYSMWGSGSSCITLSNLGIIKLPEEMARHVKGAGAISVIRPDAPNNSAVITYGGKTEICFSRSIKETELERLFFTQLAGLGVGVKVESNSRK